MKVVSDQLLNEHLKANVSFTQVVRNIENLSVHFNDSLREIQNTFRVLIPKQVRNLNLLGRKDYMLPYIIDDLFVKDKTHLITLSSADRQKLETLQNDCRDVLKDLHEAITTMSKPNGHTSIAQVYLLQDELLDIVKQVLNVAKRYRTQAL